MKGKLFIALSLLVSASYAQDEAQKSIEGNDTIYFPLHTIVYYDIGFNLTLNCTLRSADSALVHVWKKNNNSLEAVSELIERYKLVKEGAFFMLKTPAVESDYGNYSCFLGDQEMSWMVHGRPVAHLPNHTNAIEGQKIKLFCKVTGKPYPVVTWSTGNKSLPLVSGDRLSLTRNEQGVENASLVMDSAQHADAGLYTCHVGAHGVNATTTVRVKDMYAAVWPFLGICGEVLVLFIIIMVYEKNRVKPEIDPPIPQRSRRNS